MYISLEFTLFQTRVGFGKFSPIQRSMRGHLSLENSTDICNRGSIFSVCLWRLVLHLHKLEFAYGKET